MSLAEDMLATMSVSDDSVSYLAEEEPHIVINESRQAIVPNELRTIAVTGDKDIETITFDCVRYWDGNDLSTFAIYLNYVLPDLTTGTYIPEKITTTDGDEFYHFDWQIKNNITVKSGKISFAVTAISTTTNFAGNPIVDKQWSSLPNSDCSIALGIDVSNVPSEEESSAVLGQMSAILEQIQTDFDDWLKNSVVQTTGDSTTAVMSQRATTKEFDLLKTRLKLYDDAYSIIVTGLENTYYIAMRNSKQIENLKTGISEQFETDSSVAYVKDVPPNALPYAEVKKIGGMTYKTKNLLPFPYLFDPSDLNDYGVTCTVNNDGSIKIVGTPNRHTYVTLAQMDLGYNGISVDSGNGEYRLTDCGYARTYGVYIYLEMGVSLDRTFYPMVEIDTGTESPYEPYFEGLRSAKVTGVKSVGVNLIPYPHYDTAKTVNGITFTDNGDGTVTANGTATDDAIYRLIYDAQMPAGSYVLSGAPSGENYGVMITGHYADVDGSPFYLNVYGGDEAGKVLTIPTNTMLYLYIRVQSGTTVTNCVFKPMLNKGSTDQPYTPYVEHTLPIPEAVRPANGINAEVYDSIEWSKDGRVKTKRVKCGVVDLGTLAWAFNNGNIFQSTTLGAIGRNILCSHYEFKGVAAGNADAYNKGDKTISLYYGDSRIYVRDDSFNGDAATFKAAMSGVMLVYELAEPIVTDISDLITADNLIGVEGGGTLTFENDYKYDVPSVVEYQLEV